MNKNLISLSLLLVILLSFPFKSYSQQRDGYAQLVELFWEWRTFEKPPLLDGAPDYSASTFESRDPEFYTIREKLNGFDTSGWAVPERIDYLIIWAEMNGYEFNRKVLKPWERDPAFYKTIWTYRSDVPAHEGPTHHAPLELWTYQFPLGIGAKQRLLAELQVILSINSQAKENLKGKARDLWVAGIRDIENQASDLKELSQSPEILKEKSLLEAVNNALVSTEDLVKWLKKESKSKNGPSGLGEDLYSWYLQNVHLVPLSWSDEVMLLKSELARAWASLKLEEHRNRNLPELKAVNSVAAYDSLADVSARSLMNFLEEDDILTVKDYFEPALREQLGAFVPEETRNFFWITAHYDPRPLYSHFYHWFELAQMEYEPHQSEIRRYALLYNIFDSHNEGLATAVEEVFMQAGLYDDNPRVREIVYIMIAQRSARGLGSLYAHANTMTMEEAGNIHSEYTPRGWMKTEKELLIFEQHLYLRQPGYGTSYITGKYLIENAMTDFAKQCEDEDRDFELSEFFDEINAIGNIPAILGHWQMTGNDLQVRGILKNFRPLDDILPEKY